MAGIVAAGAVRRAAGDADGWRATREPRESRFVFSLATEADDAELRALLAAHPFDGEIQVTLEREPSFAAATAVDGDVSDTIVARDRATGRIVAMGTRSERDVYINGAASRVGYLGQLRIVPECRGQRQILLQGFAACRALHHRGRVRFYLASVVAANARASRLLTSTRLQQGIGGLPRFDAYARIATLLLRTRRRSRRHKSHPSISLPGGLRVVRGTAVLRSAIASCLARNQLRFQLASQWRIDDDDNVARGPRLKDFFVAVRCERVVGCLARWDQRAFKQVRVRGYAPRLARWRPVINLIAPLFGVPRLPRPGELLPFAYLSHVAVDDDDPVVLRALVESARTAPAVDYLVVGLAERHPLLQAFAGMRVRRYVSQLYLVSWEDGRAAIDALDGRLPHVEVATL